MIQFLKTRIIHRKDSFSYGSAPLHIQMTGVLGWRFTFNLSPVIRFAIQHHYQMPNFEKKLTRLAGLKAYHIFDLSHAYWQPPYDYSSQECESFVTQDEMFTTTKVLRGTITAVTRSQAAITMNLHESLRQDLLVWLNKLLLCSPNVPILMKGKQ